MTKSYTDSAYYSISLTSRFLKVFIVQMLDKLEAGISADEVFALDILKNNKGICQRDLAKMLFKANTGKLAATLRDKGLIDISAEQKNNRLIKQLSLTDKGHAFLNNLLEKSKPLFDKISHQFTKEEDELLRNMLLKLRTGLEAVIESQI